MKVKSWLMAMILCAVVSVGAQARYYDPTAGRFITADTIVQAPNDPQSLNRYAYVRNNPVNLTDPSGHSWLSMAWRKSGANDLWKNVAPYVAPGIWMLTTGEGRQFWNKNRDYIVAGTIVAVTGGYALAYGGPVLWGATAGEVAGGYVAYKTDSDIITGTIIGGAQGAFTGAMMGGIDQAGMNPLMEIAMKGHVGGVMAGINGGTYEKGFAYMAAAASMQQIFESVVGYPATPEPGKPLPKGVYDPLEFPHRAPPSGYAVTGINKQVQGNPWGPRNIFKQAGGLGRVGNWTPAVKATSQFHDTWVNNMSHVNLLANVGTMAPSLGIGSGALMATYWSPFTTYWAVQESK